MPLSIREYRDPDAVGLRACIVALQDYERSIDPRLLPGDTIADAYRAILQARGAESQGTIFVADRQGAIIGFVAVLAHVLQTELDEPPGTYALVSDLMVMPACRGHGIGRALLQHGERYARTAGATELRVGVLSDNPGAHGLYRTAGFAPYFELLVKRLDT